MPYRSDNWELHRSPKTKDWDITSGAPLNLIETLTRHYDIPSKLIKYIPQEDIQIKNSILSLINKKATPSINLLHIKKVLYRPYYEPLFKYGRMQGWVNKDCLSFYTEYSRKTSPSFKLSSFWLASPEFAHLLTAHIDFKQINTSLQQEGKYLKPKEQKYRKYFYKHDFVSQTPYVGNLPFLYFTWNKDSFLQGQK